MNTHGPAGSLTEDGGVNVITFVRDFTAPPERVWGSLTTTEGLTAWLAPDVTIEARPGGSISFTFDADNTVTGTITTFDPPRVLEHGWVINGEVTSTLRYTLEPHEGGTRLTLVHEGLPDAMCRGYAPGWHAYLARLDATLDGSEPPAWMDVFEDVGGLYREHPTPTEA